MNTSISIVSKLFSFKFKKTLSHSVPKNILLGVCLSFMVLNIAQAADVLIASPPTAGFDTPLLNLGRVEGVRAVSRSRFWVNWGDRSSGPALLDCAITITNGSLWTCNFYGRHKYAKPGNYVAKVIRTPPCVTGVLNNCLYQPADVVEYRRPVKVASLGDFIIASIGDSVASGEGNPEVPFRLGHLAYWDYGDDGCHGSLKSGAAKAAAEIRRSNPNTSVTFIDLACSGAILGEVTDSTPHTATGQLAELAKYVPPDRAIDALIISVGANDMCAPTLRYPKKGKCGFDSVLYECFINGICSIDPHYLSILNKSIAKIPQGYLNLQERLDCTGRQLSSGCTPIQVTQIIQINRSLPSSGIHVTEYFDPTTIADLSNPGNWQYPDVEQTKQCTHVVLNSGIWDFAQNNIVKPLNTTIRSAVEFNSWINVGGIESDFLGHGYCQNLSDNSNKQRWVITLNDTSLMLGSTPILGTAHPNTYGHDAYSKRLVKSINAMTAPVTIASPTINGDLIEFDVAVNQDVFVTLSASNKLDTAGLKNTYYALDKPDCVPTNLATCDTYTSPFTVSSNGDHTLTYFSANASGNFELPHNVTVIIKKPPESGGKKPSESVGESGGGSLSIAMLSLLAMLYLLFHRRSSLSL